MQRSARLGTIVAIGLLALGASAAIAQSPCCAEADGFRCREAPSATEFVFAYGATGCWESDDGSCIGGSPLQNCVCVGDSCMARYWGDNPQSIQLVYVPVSAEDCARAAKSGCCNRNRNVSGNCQPPK